MIARVADKTIGQMDQLAEDMANGAKSISAAGRRQGLSQQRASQLWARICADLGEQAR
jgi:hypothetical protein